MLLAGQRRDQSQAASRCGTLGDDILISHCTPLLTSVTNQADVPAHVAIEAFYLTPV